MFEPGDEVQRVVESSSDFCKKGGVYTVERVGSYGQIALVGNNAWPTWFSPCNFILVQRNDTMFKVGDKVQRHTTNGINGCVVGGIYTVSGFDKEGWLQLKECPTSCYYDPKFFTLWKRPTLVDSSDISYTQLKPFTAEDLRKDGACDNGIEEFIKRFGFTKPVPLDHTSLQIMANIYDCIPFLLRKGYIKKKGKMVKKEVKAWANIYKKSPICFHSSLSESNINASKDRIACVELTGTYEVEE